MWADRLDGPPRRQRTHGKVRRDANEKKTSSGTDGGSVKRTGGAEADRWTDGRTGGGGGRGHRGMKEPVGFRSEQIAKSPVD